MGKTAIAIVLLLLGFLANGQQNLRFGEWESHLPYQRGLSVTQSPNKIYFATDFSIMSIDKEDNSLEFISKVEGLSNIGISDLKYDESTGYIFVIYTNEEIDIITPEGVVNVSDIRNNTGIIDNKTINDVHFSPNKEAFLATDFGMVSFDLETFEFGFTTQMGMKANTATLDDNGLLYAATVDGVYSLDLNRNFNFSDFSNWRFLGSEVGLPMLYEAVDVEYFSGSLWLITDNKVWNNKTGVFQVYSEPESGEVFRFFSTDGPELMIGSRTESQNISQVKYVNESLEMTSGVKGCANYINDAIMDESGRVWYADEWRGFKFTNGKDGDCFDISNRSTFSHSVSELLVDDGVLYAVSGGVSDAFNPQANRDGIYVLRDGVWTNYNQSNTSIFGTEEFINIYRIAKNPYSDQFFLGSFYSGLMQVDLENKDFKLYHNENSPIKGSPSVPGLEKVAGLAFDANDNLWISAQDAEKPLVALTPEGNFHSFDIKSSSRLAQITVDDFGNKWIQVIGSAGGVLVYNDGNESIANPSDDEQRFINQGNSELPTSVVNCITKDLDGEIWVGTGEGPVTFTGDPFSKDAMGNFLSVGNTGIVFEDSIPARLLQTEDIRAIAVDGGNQKWFGTRNGIFVQSPDGLDKVARFTVDNSPLFSDNIIDMEFDPASGKMYIASDGGIQAYQTLTTGGGERHKSNVYAFPNPVRPDYEGLIGFKGLARDATIKVTDINGQLVHEGSALGGQATWDGRDYSGRKVASGVYLVFSNATVIGLDDNPDTAVTKVLIVR